MNENYTIDINNLIALCHILDDFKQFESLLFYYISPKYNRKFVFQLWDVSRGKFQIGGRKAKKFYAENKKTIDTINKYSSVTTFINRNYGWYGEPNEGLQFFYKYLLAHKEDIDKILAVLKKLKELKFDEIEFNREIDFTQEEQYVYTWFADNIEITYMDNMVIIPDYSSGYVKYKSNDSSYKITIGSFRGYYKILLNNLVFDSNRLPDNSQKKDLFENIMALRNEKTDEITAVRNSVDIGVAIQDLYNMFNIVSLKIDQIDDIDKKKELKELLVSIKETIEKMQAISKEYDKTIASENPTISEAFLNEQKDEFVRRREDNKLHIW
ncbi:MAG: hypothetical protein E7163_00365 [Firmicutes bacterium]|nr:hypothetical protein [Bacillota bacterium]